MNKCEKALLDDGSPLWMGEEYKDNPLWRSISKDLALILCGKGELFNLSKEQIDEFYKKFLQTVQKNKKTLKEKWNFSKFRLRGTYRVGYAYPTGISSVEVGSDKSRYEENGIANSFCVKITNVFSDEENFPYIKLTIPLDLPSLSIKNGVVILNRGSSDGKYPDKISFALKYNNLKEYLYDINQLQEHIIGIVNRATGLLSEVESELFYTATPVVIALAYYNDGSSNKDETIEFRIDSASGFGSDFRNGNAYDKSLMDKLFDMDTLPPESKKLYDYIIKNKKVSSIENCIQLFPEIDSFFTNKEVEKNVLDALKKGNTVYWDDVKDYIAFKFDKVRMDITKGINIGRYKRAEISWRGYLYIHNADSYINSTSNDIIKKVGEVKFITDDLHSLVGSYNVYRDQPFMSYVKVPYSGWEKFLDKDIVAFKLPVKGKTEDAYKKVEKLITKDLKEVAINGKNYKFVHSDDNYDPFYCSAVYGYGKWYVLLKLDESKKEVRTVNPIEKNRVLDKIYANKVK